MQSVYNAQVKTFSIAREITGDFRQVTHGSAAFAPPFSLRTVRDYRTPEIQAFRDQVAREARKRRS